MQEVSPPIFQSWAEIAVILLSLSATWAGMLAMLRGIRDAVRELHHSSVQAREADRRWMEESLGRLLDEHNRASKEHEAVMEALTSERQAHTADHKSIELKMVELIGEMRRLIDAKQQR